MRGMWLAKHHSHRRVPDVRGLQISRGVRVITARDEAGRPVHVAGQRTPLDAYDTPDDLAKMLVGLLPIEPGDMALEPHAGAGAFCRALVGAGANVLAQDIDHRAPALARNPDWHSYHGDFLAASYMVQPRWVIGNPPFTDADKHIRKAIDVSERHVALLLRLAILSSQKRHRLWMAHPPRCVWVMSSRPSFMEIGTDRFDYAWIWWDKQHTGLPTLAWLP